MIEEKSLLPADSGTESGLFRRDHARSWSERVAQAVEHVTFNHGVAGSSPAALTNKSNTYVPAAGETYPAPTASQVPAPAVNTTVAIKITASIRDNVQALGMRMASVPTQGPAPVENLCISCG
jgi:hypothetical protein